MELVAPSWRWRRHSWWRVPGTFVVGITLVAAVVFNVWSPKPKPRKFVAKLEELLPAGLAVEGWAVTRQPIAESEEMKRAVAELLNFDDAVFATYLQGEMRVSIYAAYWMPGKMSHRLIASHTPDVCWVGGGWNSRKKGTENVAVDRAGIPLVLEYRVFEQRGQTEDVIFLHFVGGKALSYQTGRQPPWHAVFSDLLNKGLRQRDEQLFVRISGNRPLGEFKDAPPVQAFLRRLSVELEKMRGSDGRRSG